MIKLNKKEISVKKKGRNNLRRNLNIISQDYLKDAERLEKKLIRNHIKIASLMKNQKSKIDDLLKGVIRNKINGKN